nr:MAG TPA: hypothetical protein [Caudoviricetes sp.]
MELSLSTPKTGIETPKVWYTFGVSFCRPIWTYPISLPTGIIAYAKVKCNMH